MLRGLLDDPTVAGSAVEALGKLKYLPARDEIALLVENPVKDVQEQAKKALKAMNKVATRPNKS